MAHGVRPGFPKEHGRARPAVAHAEERLLYDPWDPNYVTMLDNLPGSPAIDEAGHLKSASPLRALAVAILPTVTILGHGLYVYYRLLQ